MSTGSSPPAQPPMMSPDGRWVWNGQKWIPVAVHESAFPQYNRAVAAAQNDPPVAETMVAAPINPFAEVAAAGAPASPFGAPPPASRFSGPPSASPFPSPANPMPAAVSPLVAAPIRYGAGSYVPPWQQWAGSGSPRSRAMYLAGAFIAVVLGVIVTIYFVSSWLPFLRADSPATANTAPAVTPTPQLPVRSDSALAGRYVGSAITPSIDEISPPLANYIQACNGTMSNSCQQALSALKPAVADSLARVATTPPPCIAAQVTKVRADLTLMQTGIAKALKGFSDNNHDELLSGLGTFNNGAHPLVTVDAQAVSKVEGSCDDQPQGP